MTLVDRSLVGITAGVWINWSRGAILGSTLTLSEGNGGLLTSFLGIFVSATGGAFWRIMSYIIHQSRAKLDQQDGLHHQGQVVLRNASTPGSAAWQLIQLVFHWWDCAKRPALRFLPLAMLALTNLVLFSLAGVFSAQVTKAAGNETLIKSPNCGAWGISDSQDPQVQAAFRSKTLLDTTSASTYARSCYGQVQNPLDCNQYTQPNISWVVNQNASCPFLGGICRYGDHAAYQMDTGAVDSHQVLGVNAPPADRITYRKVTTCSPIQTKGYAEEWNNTVPNTLTTGDTFDRLYFGPISDISNFTYAHDEHSPFNGYQLETLFASPGESYNSWIPIPELNRTDADVSLFLLAQNTITYDSPVFDPFFGASLLDPISAALNRTRYASDLHVTALGCIDQHQFCNPSNKQCTPLTGFDLVSMSFSTLVFNPRQSALALRILLLIEAFNMYNSVHGRGSSALRASETLSETMQVGLPNHQWQIEVDSWMAVGMAKLQQLTVQYATGPLGVVGDSFTIKPPDANFQAMCDTQKVRSSGGTTSFSLLGVAIILIFGTSLILLNFVLDTVVGSVQRKLGRGDHKRLQWVIDEKLQLQRLAYEEAGQGTWTGGANGVPITRMGDRIGIPRNVDKIHPKLSVLPGHGRVESTVSFYGQSQSDMAISQPGVPEAEALVRVKGAYYDVQSVDPAPEYHGYQF